MRHVQHTGVETHLAQILDEVETGATVVITREGKAIARLVPEAANEHKAKKIAAIAAIKEMRKSMTSMTIEEILSARHEGHKY